MKIVRRLPMKTWITLCFTLVGIFFLGGCSAKSAGQGDYPPMIMVEDTLYKSTGVEIPMEIDERAILGQTSSYATGQPKKNGEVNFNRNLGDPYAKIEGGIAVLMDNEWVRFEKMDGISGLSTTCADNDFELKLFANKASYTVDESIQIWATLEYVGEKDTVTIWHGLPYIAFSITDGADFNVDGMVLTLLTSTELSKGEIYEFDYVKSGGFSADDPNAEYWEKFYQEEELKLPKGIYTVTVRGEFALSEDVVNDDSGLSCQLQLEVK